MRTTTKKPACPGLVPGCINLGYIIKVYLQESLCDLCGSACSDFLVSTEGLRDKSRGGLVDLYAHP